MKKILAILLATLLLLGMSACGTINDTNIAVLWSDTSEAVSPNSLINAMDRAMYIQSIGYEYYGAEKDQNRQLEQAKNALDAGCSALLVELVDRSAAQQIVDLAKEKSVPVVFFNSIVEEEVLASYEKCYAVTADASSMAKVQGEMILEYVKNTKNLDRNGDGKVTYAKLGTVPFVLKSESVVFEETYVDLADLDPEAVEMIITADDLTAMQVLIDLQSKDFNTDKLTTQSVVLFTVGNEADYKEYVLKDAPADEAELKKHYEANKFLVDLTVVEEEDIAEMIFTTLNVIDTGRIAGTVIVDYDAMAENVAAITANLLKNKEVTKGIEGMDGQVLKVSYTTYGA